MIADPVLVVVDMQRDFTSVDAVGDSTHIEDALRATGTFLDGYRRSGRSPILVRTIHDDHVDSPTWMRKYEGRDRGRPCQRASDGAAFAPELDVRDADVVVTKHRYDAFTNTDLDTYLSANDVTDLLVCGIKTDVCVESTVRSAFDRDYFVRTLADCCATDSVDAHDRALDRLDDHFGDVRTSTEIALPPLECASTE